MANDDFFNVNFTGLANTAAEMQGHYRNLDSIINELNTNLNNSLGSWDSDARQLWAQIQQKWQGKMTNAGQAIGAMSDHLDFAHDTWRGSENTNMGIWG